MPGKQIIGVAIACFAFYYRTFSLVFRTLVTMFPLNEKVHACIEPSRVLCTGLCVIPHPRKLVNAIVMISCLTGVPNAQRLLAQKASPASQSATEQAFIQGHSLKEWAKMLHRDEVPRAQARAAITKIIELVQSDVDPCHNCGLFR